MLSTWMPRSKDTNNISNQNITIIIEICVVITVTAKGKLKPVIFLYHDKHVRLHFSLLRG